MKKFFKLFLVALCLVSMLFASVACEIDERLDEKTEQELIDSVSSPEAMAQSKGFSFDVKVVENSESNRISGVCQIGANNVMNGDIVYSDKSGTAAMALRNNSLYGLELENKVGEGDLLQAVKAYVEQNVSKFAKIDSEDILDQINGIPMLPGGSLPDIGSLPIDGIPQDMVEAVTKLGKQALSAVFNKSKKTADGYVLYCDLYEIFEGIWNKVYSVAEKLDADQQITVSQLWNSEEVGAIVNPTLGNFSGKQIQEILETALEEIGTELPFEIPSAKENENAVAYIGRVLETVKVGPITIGSMRVSDLLQMANIGKIDFTEELDKLKDSISGTIKTISDALKLELHFTSQKQLSRFVFALKLTDQSVTSQPVDISVSVNLLSAEPTLWNLAGLK